MSNFKSRKPWYWFYLILGTLLVVISEYQTHSALVKEDPSVQEWFAFLPLLVPLYIAQVACVIVPVAIVIESLLYCARFFKKENIMCVKKLNPASPDCPCATCGKRTYNHWCEACQGKRPTSPPAPPRVRR